MRPQTYILKDPRDRAFAIRAITLAKDGMQVRISKPDRNNDQNRLYHGLLGAIVDQLPWPKDTGELHDLEWWKRRTTLGWLLEKRREVEIITALDGEEFGILLPHTSHLSTEQYAELVEWTTMFGATNGVKFKERAPEPPPPENDR